MEVHSLVPKLESASSSPAGPDRLGAARFAHANLQDMVKFADAKAGALIAAQALAATVLGSESLGDASVAIARLVGAPEPLVRLALLVPTGVAIGFALAVLWPRRPDSVAAVPGSPRLLWISEQDLARFKGSTSDYVAALQETTEVDLVADVAFENLKITAILANKFKWLKLSLWGLAAAVVSWCVILLSAP